MSTITARSIKRRTSGMFKSNTLTLQQVIAQAQRMSVPFAVSGRDHGRRVAVTATHFRRSQAITGIHPTKKATPGRTATVTLFHS